MLRVEINDPKLLDFYQSLDWHPFEIMLDKDCAYTKNFRHILNRMAGAVKTPSLLQASLRALASDMYLWEQMWKLTLAVNDTTEFKARLGQYANRDSVKLEFRRIKEIGTGLVWALGGNLTWLDTFSDAMKALKQVGIISDTTVMGELTADVERSIVILKKILPTAESTGVGTFDGKPVMFVGVLDGMFSKYMELLESGVVIKNSETL